MRLPKLRESVDVYVVDSVQSAVFYFLNTRRELRVRVNDLAIELLALLDGTRTPDRLLEELSVRCGATVLPDDVTRFLDYLQQKSVLTDAAYEPPSGWFSAAELARYDRQISYWGDFCQTPSEKFTAQKRLKDACVVIIGCGAVGSWIALELAMMGVGRLVLMDHDRAEPSDTARHALASQGAAGAKVDWLAEQLRCMNPNTIVTAHPLRLTPVTQLNEVCQGAHMVVNCADEPYIGLTALKVSEYCVPRGIPHYIGGGFDAHLASTGELVLPGRTPCAFCYADHFTAALKDWTPSPHPVAERRTAMGGLSSLSVFSASYAVLDIVGVLTGLDLSGIQGGRGEFIFERMDIDFVDVNRNPACRVCGDQAVARGGRS
jgi:molybdopterin-synthase adenylyltransferase